MAQLGTAVHVGTALYDNSVLHDSAPLSVADCEGEVVDTIWRPEDDVGDFGIADIKTGRQIVATDGRVKTSAHAVQMGVYELLAEQAIGKKMEAPARIIGLQAGKTATGQRAGVGEITGARELLVGEDDGEHGALEMAAAILRFGLFFGNPRSAICGGKYCPVWAICNCRK